jgi:hypothetical protein
MKLAKTFSFVLVAVSTLMAADNPFIGTWKEDFAKTYIAHPNALVSALIRIESAGENRIKITQDGSDAAGKENHSIGVYTLDGSESRPSGLGEVVQSFRPINEHVWERIAMYPGDVRHGYWAVSNDSKLLIITAFGKDRNGNEYYYHRVLERQ